MMIFFLNVFFSSPLKLMTTKNIYIKKQKKSGENENTLV